MRVDEGTPMNGQETPPLFGVKGAIVAAAALGVVAVLFLIAYALGNPTRYVDKLVVSLDNVLSREIEVEDAGGEIPYSHKPAGAGSMPAQGTKTRKVVEVVGTVENTGRRDVRAVALEVLLKDAGDKTVGVCRTEVDRWSDRFAVRAGGTVTFQLQVTPLSDDWVAEKTAVRVTDLKFGTT